MNEETSAGAELDGPLLASGDMDCPYCRKPFRQPRLLMCLHAFCEDCIVAMLEGRSEEKQNALDVELESLSVCETQTPPGVVRCPICKQDSQIGNDLRFVQSLVPDFVTMNLQDANALEQMQLECESCKSKENAVARCVDCANVLCPNCVQAHQYMRCFENHKVLTFEEIKNSGEDFLIHKPILCSTHANEQVRFFCKTCRISVCNECLLTTHKFVDHEYLKSTPETDAVARDHLQKLLAKGRGKVLRCDGESHEMENKLKELQDSVEETRNNVEFVFEKYQELLTKRKEQTLADLNQLQHDLETKIMRTSQQIGNTSEKIHDALRFTERLLKHGNTMEIFCTSSMVEAQMLQVIHSVPSAQFSVRITFENNEKHFEEILNKNTGYFHADLEQRAPQTFTSNEFNTNLSNSSTPYFTTSSSIVGGEHSLYNGQPTTNGVGGVMSDLNESLSEISSLVNGGGGKNRLHSGGNSSTDSTSGGGGGTTNYWGTSTSTTHGVVPTYGNNIYATLNGPSSTNNSSVLYNFERNIERLGAVASQYSSGELNGVANGTISPSYGLKNSRGANNFMSANHLTISTSRNVSPLDSLSGNSSQMFNCVPSMNGGAYGASMNGGVGNNYGRGTTSGVYSRISPPSDVSSTGSNGILPGLPPNIFSSQAVSGQSNMTGLNPPIRQGQMNHVSIHNRIGSLGPGHGQFNSPHGFCLSPDEDIVVADTNNHRIQLFTKTGEFRGEFGTPGKEEGQLWYPRKVATLRNNGKFIVCDRGNERSRMQLFNRNGNFCKKIAIRYIDIVAGLAIDSAGRVVAVDSVSPTVFCIDENGDLVHWFDCSNQMKEPSDIAVFQQEYFICDFKGHCVCVFSEQGSYLRKIGCEGVTNFPNGIDISDLGDILIGDSHGNRFHVAVFKKTGELQSEFECPQVKVSRCCGLRITSEGYIITIAKNNHHVLILNTLYLT